LRSDTTTAAAPPATAAPAEKPVLLNRDTAVSVATGGVAEHRDYKTPWQKMQESSLLDTLAAPRPQLRQPLILNTKLEYTTKTKKYTFQSDERDTTLYPSPSYYRLPLPVPQRNVIGIYLNVAVLPISEYIVNSYNQYIDILDAGVTYSVPLPVGDYTTGAALATGLQTAITTFNPALAAYTVAYDPLTYKLTFNTNGGPCQILWRSGPNVNRNLWIITGFPREDTALAATITAPGVIDLVGTLAVDLFIEEIACNIDSTDNMMTHINLQKFTPNSAVTYFSPPDNGVPQWFWPIARLQFLTFAFLVKYTAIEPDGTLLVRFRPYEFNGRQHTMQINVVSRQYRNQLEEDVELDPMS
jgi:hypothetical protein